MGVEGIGSAPIIDVERGGEKEEYWWGVEVQTWLEGVKFAKRKRDQNENPVFGIGSYLHLSGRQVHGYDTKFP